jgi:hypothetical protein
MMLYMDVNDVQASDLSDSLNSAGHLHCFNIRLLTCYILGRLINFKLDPSSLAIDSKPLHSEHWSNCPEHRSHTFTDRVPDSH